jgi:predicted nucleic acid-binding protein
MSFLLDTDLCSAYLKNDRQVVGKVMLHFGGLHVSVVLITHNTRDYVAIPGLTLDDWLVP